MKELDFLPRSFHEAIRRRRRNRRNLIYSLALATVLAVLHGLSNSQIRSAEAALATFREGAGLRGSQRSRLISLRQTKVALQAKAELLSQLADDAPPDAVIAEINRLMGPSMALRSLSIKTSLSAEVTGSGANGVRPERVPEVAAGQSAAGIPRQSSRMEGVLLGVAANDVEVGTFFGKLSSCALLDEVRLSFSRETEQSGRSMREFELRFVLRRVALEGSDR